MYPPKHNGLNIKQIRNAFNCIVFADPVHGIFGATPVETTHAFRKGVVENVTKLVLSKFQLPRILHLTIWLLLFTNLIGKHFVRHIQRQVGTMGLRSSQISPQTNVLVLFLFVIRFQYNEGWQIIQSCLDKQTNSNKVPEVLQAFECLLCFDAWLNKSHYWDTSNPEHVPQETRSIQASIRKFTMMCKKSIPIE
jgi:hypothetical protein